MNDNTDNVAVDKDNDMEVLQEDRREELQYHLFVNLKAGQDLVAKDSCGTSDPYVKFLINEKVVHKSSTLHKNLNPAWDESFLVTLTKLSDPLKLKVYDYNLVSRDVFMGETFVDLDSLEQNKSLDIDLQLTDGNDEESKNLGKLLVSINLVGIPMDVGSTTANLPIIGSKRQVRPAVVSVVLVRMELETVGEIFCKFRLGEETCRSRSVVEDKKRKCFSWMEQFDLTVPDQANIQQLTIKVKSGKETVGSSEVDVSSLTREVSHRQRLTLGEGWLEIVVTLTGLSSQDRHTIKGEEVRGRVGKLEVKLLGVQGLSATKLTGQTDTFCVVELDNTQLQTSTEYRSLNPTWGSPSFLVPVGDIYSVIHIVVMERGQGGTSIIGRLCIPLVDLVWGGQVGPTWYLLKDKRLRGQARGGQARLGLDVRLVDWNPIKALILTIQPREEVVFQRTEKFKRRVLNNNIIRIKTIVTRLMASGREMRSQLHWDSRGWTVKAWLLFLTVSYLLEPFMIPLGLVMAFLINMITRDQKGQMSGKTVVTAEEDLPENEKEADNVSLKELMQTVQELFPLVQNVLGSVASLAERLENCIKCQVPLLSILAMFLLIIISFLLHFVTLRILVMLIGSVKFVRNIVKPGACTNNELVDFLSRVPDHEMLEDSRQIQSEQNTSPSEKKMQ